MTTSNPTWQTVDLQWHPTMPAHPVTTLLLPTRPSMAEQNLIARMWVLCAIEMHPKLQAIPAANLTRPHFARYRAFIAAEVERLHHPHYPQVPDSRALVELSSAERQSLIAALREQTRDTELWPVIEGPWRVYENVVDIVEGRVKLVKVLLKDGLLERFYDWANGLSEVRPLFQLLGQSRPGLRVLEIGAGTGGTTARALEGLAGGTEGPGFGEYVFTDISTLFFEKARERFQGYEGVEYRALDITKDPAEQGFEIGRFDVVVASNVLHATPCLVETLKHCRLLLQPKGVLFLQELSPPGKYVDYMVGLLPGWWLGEADGRADGPCVPPEEWDQRLQLAGFEGLHAVGLDSEPPFYYNANMLARPAV
ncbi:class I SAM-dependent methyltransferase [Aspergillus fijiensis CBS 313.89]|uniref:S-adenosyl-L-methionine-dependent methyltransferase n=1 Tax=Aspergillus fijiensis CBS 313.89 TaxID=1448319 RepID=A0A8G1RRS3_9EURO|nr:S-adenosyl-L-methionine-dependent methyltransferase [Aspergillus fijiensis CBS 313.89]RAK78084.1 S-adenosyl-L-methionine-dependent methyltransferase [Aspergillus fijiensis CBS 313.89]